MPTNDYYGGHRHGDNLFSDSLVAVDLETGERLWHYQLIHHDVWDWDIPCAPILADVTIDGVERKIVAQPTKQAWLYVFDRETGEPIWPIEERAVEASNVPGELLSPTQPFPTKPPAYDRQGVDLDALVDFTPEIRRRAEEIAARHRLGPIFTPPVVSESEGPYGTLMLPSQTGGTNWPGGSIDPETFTTESGEEGAMLRAYDKASGEELGAVFMPAGVSGSPMTYMHEGRQYIATAHPIRSSRDLARFLSLQPLYSNR